MATRTQALKSTQLVDRYAQPPKVAGTPSERAKAARAAMTGLKAGVRVTKAMYRPSSR